jgi:glucosamine-6-phosphate deaminase
MDRLTPVEQAAVAASAFDALYEPAERIPTVMVDNFPALGRLAAMRFVEWVQDHLEGVISLPTGKTLEHFIRWVQRLLQTWQQAETQAEARIDTSRKPRLDGLHFVQIDEFCPIEPSQSRGLWARC